MVLVFPPALKKGMVRLLKKRALSARGNVSKGHFQRATISKWALFLSARRAHKLSTVIKFNTVAVFSVFCLFLGFSLSFVLSSVSIFQDSLLPETTKKIFSHYFNTNFTMLVKIKMTSFKICFEN